MQLNDTSKRVVRYNNAIKRKYHNKHVVLCRGEDDTYDLEIINLDKDFANEPCIEHKVEKGIVRISHLRMSKETLVAFLLNAIELLGNEADVIKSVCEHKHKTKIGFGISDSVCDNCGKRIEQTVL